MLVRCYLRKCCFNVEVMLMGRLSKEKVANKLDNYVKKMPNNVWAFLMCVDVLNCFERFWYVVWMVLNGVQLFLNGFWMYFVCFEWCWMVLNGFWLFLNSCECVLNGFEWFWIGLNWFEWFRMIFELFRIDFEWF